MPSQWGPEPSFESESELPLPLAALGTLFGRRSCRSYKGMGLGLVFLEELLFQMLFLNPRKNALLTISHHQLIMPTMVQEALHSPLSPPPPHQHHPLPLCPGSLVPVTQAFLGVFLTNQACFHLTALLHATSCLEDFSLDFLLTDLFPPGSGGMSAPHPNSYTPQLSSFLSLQH